ncbi:MAG: BMP family ABC transporter substrate-binding protein, partial [Burkholderiaceae bacterium]
AYHSDMRKFGPKAQLAAVTHHWGDYYTRRAQAVLDGSWSVAPVWGGIKEGFIKLEGLSEQLPPTLVAEVKAKESAIRDGSFHPFTGPLKSNEGADVIASGALNDEQLGKMDYYVIGVVGRVPSGSK